jgi:hypothetical protein
MLLLMRRIQLFIDEEVDDALARRAHELDIPKAALIREYLSQHVTVTKGHRDDPSDLLIGVYQGDAQESAMVDMVLYGP